ncbi:MAG TPA: DNA repair protein [Candidatus Blautia excrementipullorum]|nr:DNA repair protein [Candidatus Blautia excrementipullorum]
MRPLKLTMQAFGSYGEKTTIDFEMPDQNLFLITGDTGAGKTTIFDAIVFALYGEASSSENKKEGVVLQSQYADYGREPFVELVFAEGTGKDRDVYTVRRVPRHLKLITRGAAKGVGTREIAGAVALILPDGTEYPQKEADKKLQEIVGLTKNQFMQVAMIAQGEFMEVLRAKSDDKKVIFRKLFHTDIYQDIVNELGNRKREKEKEIAVLKTRCQTETVRVKIPEEYERKQQMSELKKSILDGDFAAAGEFMDELQLLTAAAGEDYKKAEEEYKDAARERDKKRDELAGAVDLQKMYQNLESAEAELEILDSQTEEIRKKENLAEQLTGAFEIQKKFRWLKETEETAEKTREVLRENQKKLPGIIENADRAKREAEKAKLDFEREQEKFSRMSERANSALDLFEKISRAKKRTESGEKSFQKAREEEETLKQKQKELEEREKLWKEQEEKLSKAEQRLLLWEAKYRESEEIKKEIRALKETFKTTEEYRKQAEKSQAGYASAREEYKQIRDSYEKMRQTFLDAQAGFLARILEEGKPCPVCGSLTHPSPCQWKEEYGDVSEEGLEELENRKEELRQNQEKFAAEARANLDLAEAKTEDCQEKWDHLKERITAAVSEIPDDFRWEQAGETVETWAVSVQKEGDQCRKDVDFLNEIRLSLKGVEEEKGQQKEALAFAEDAVRKAEKDLAAARAELSSLSGSTEFSSREEAKEQMRLAEAERDKRKAASETAEKAAEVWKMRRQQTETLIARYIEELPSMEQKISEKRSDYQREMENRKLTESGWKVLARTYEEESAESLRKEINDYQSRKEAAIKLRDSMKKAVGKRKKPVLEELKRQAEEAENRLKISEKNRNARQSLKKDNQEVYDALVPRMEERQQTLMQHGKLDALYRMTSGNVSGSRMDLETYVQRYYLERILHAANRRFREMSTGQFELRMYDLKKAGEGKNRGLDLMVYSTVTGKEREVRTLSGGESFMAALSLALGTADQIQQSSSSIHLDMMFIDEGFGSLDEHSRNQAVKVLLKMAEGSRLIGIISHVTELKQEIEDQLLVRKDETGSHVRWQIS